MLLKMSCSTAITHEQVSHSSILTCWDPTLGFWLGCFSFCVCFIFLSNQQFTQAQKKKPTQNPQNKNKPTKQNKQKRDRPSPPGSTAYTNCMKLTLKVGFESSCSVSCPHLLTFPPNLKGKKEIHRLNTVIPC